MQSDRVSAVMKKELGSYFTSPVAFIFLSVFLVAIMFVFFWVDNFFARNIVDVRPLFEWMPLLLIFLVSALTMRMWSEERRMGTIEFLLTTPVRTIDLVAGKFLACLVLVSIALALTLVLPVAVSFMGDLDWGPVLGGYLAALLLAGAYIAIGLFVSAKTDSQIVALIVGGVVCYAFYLVGSEAIAPLLGQGLGEVFRLLGSGSRFESIARGVIDLRDLYYYLSLMAVFLVLNVFALERLKWSAAAVRPRHSALRWITALVIVNFLAANFWLEHLRFLRVDLTSGRLYTVSSATESMLQQLREPLVLRGYFSSKTHPLLAPLVPQIRDLLEEYETVGGGRVRAEFVDPRENPEMEQEANQKYSIKPVPFSIQGKYEASLVNSYFDVLVSYGDKFEVLSFNDLIEVKPSPDGNLEVQLRNLEYDITRSIKKVLYGFQGVDALFANMQTPVEFVGYISAKERLPEKLRSYKDDLQKTVEELKTRAGGKLNISFVEPEAENGKAAKEIAERYNFRPMVASLFDPQQFYFYVLLQNKDKAVQIPLPETLSADGARQGLEAGLKRFSRGFLKTVGLYTPAPPPSNPYMEQFMGPQGKHFSLLNQKLAENYSIRRLDLKKGIVPEDVDLLLLVSPDKFDEKQLFAVDQFLMRGGTVVVAGSPFSVTRSRMGLNAEKRPTGLEEWLQRYGLTINEKMVLDPQSEYYPVPHVRRVGGFSVEEIEMKEYPYFVAVRDAGMNRESAILSGLPQVTLNWASPITIDEARVKDLRVTKLLRSSPAAWASPATSVAPNYQVEPRFGVLPEGKRESFLLAASLEGVFDSYFKDKESPLARKEEPKKDEGKDKEGEAEKPAEEAVFSGKIDRSAESARIVLFASNEFLTDEVLQISAMINSTAFLNSVQLVENAVDAALADPILLSIRARARFSRTLDPMDDSMKLLWEYGMCYGGSLVGLLLVFLLYRLHRKNAEMRMAQLLTA